jgi:extracellular elastinolytic metalloproteinase
MTMSSRPPGLLLVLVAALVGLALVPGSMSAPDDGSESAQATDAGDPLDTALSHVRENTAELGVTSADVADLFVTSRYTSRHNGVTHVNLNQRFRGLEVFGGHATVNIAADGRVVFVGGGFVRGLADASGEDELAAAEAVESAAEALDLDEPAGLRVLSRKSGAAQETVLSRGGISDEPIPARLGWQPTEDGLRVAWRLVIDDATDVHVWNATVDADTGELLAVDDWTDHDTRGSLASRLQRSGGQTSAAVQTLAAGPTVFEPADPVEDGSSYRVYPQESPDDSDRVLFTNPADGTASPFGWHDTDGVPGAEFTITRGNNVHSYTDRDNDGEQDTGGSPDGGAGLDFDFPIDLNEHAQFNVPANQTNMFRWCNVVHDLMYLYGFDEASGNFQVNNYGRGGVGGDDVRCEGMDGSGESNANFSTPANDGGRPRMQTMIEFGSGLPSAVTVASGPAAGTYLAQYARFSPPATTAGTPGTLVLVDDGSGAPNDGCEPYTLPPGSIAVVDTTAVCNNYTQTVNAESAGAVAVVVVHTSDTPARMSGEMDPPVGIPAIRIGLSDGATIKAAIASTPAPGSVHRNTARPPLRVGDLDTATIIHEYSHGVSNRLTGGPNVNCLTGQEQMGEGWSDWHAVVALIDTAKDDPDGPRGIFPYVIFEPPRTSPGLRNRPYSRTMEIQPSTYDSIKQGAWLNGASLSQPHGIGHAWAAFLWDMAWDLIEKRGFNPNLYDDWSTGGNNLAYQLVNDGLKFQGCAPTFVTGRNALIAAEDVLTGGEDACTLWASFSRRGLGFSASDGGTTGRNDGTEAFDTHPDCRRGFLPPVTGAYGTLTEVGAGDTLPLRFTADGYRKLDVLASNSPFSRRVDCETLRVPSVGAAVTPREFPVATQNPGNAKLSVDAQGRFNYTWKTLEEWAGTCRELVLTRDDGKQHRAFFQFVEAD